MKNKPKAENILKPCPFCGSTNLEIKEFAPSGLIKCHVWTIKCIDEDKCSVQPITKIWASKEQAVKSWNKRAIQKELT